MSYVPTSQAFANILILVNSLKLYFEFDWTSSHANSFSIYIHIWLNEDVDL